MERNILVAIILMFLLSPIYSMSDDGGNVPVVQNEESVKEVAQIEPSDKVDQANFKFETENITVLRDSNGFAVDQNGRVLVPVNRIIQDQDGKELALDSYLRNTGLTIKEFTKHNLEYLNRVLDIERKRGVKEMFRFTGDWYENRINLDKLDELQANGFEIFNDKKEGQGNSFEGIAFTKEAVIIGEIIEADVMSRGTGFTHKFKIKIDKIIKNTHTIELKDFIECGFTSYVGNYNPLPLNKKGVILLTKTINENRIKYYPIMVYKFWELEGNEIKGNPRRPNIEESMELEAFINKIDKLVRINDAENFYKHSWKEVQK